jgi:hypothetical protein
MVALFIAAVAKVWGTLALPDDQSIRCSVMATRPKVVKRQQ